MFLRSLSYLHTPPISPLNRGFKRFFSVFSALERIKRSLSATLMNFNRCFNGVVSDIKGGRIASKSRFS